MKTNILSEARSFSRRHFLDATISQQQFMHLIEQCIDGLTDDQEKVTFVTEIIRLGREIVNKSVNKLTALEQEQLLRHGLKFSEN